MTKRASQKLYQLTANEQVLPSMIDRRHRPITAAANDIPMLHWPNGHWCLPANLFMLQLFWRGLSRKNGGGTLLAYATNISHLLRYCYSNRLDLIDLNDNSFSLFIRGLMAERHPRNADQPYRDTTTVVSIGRTCLDLLSRVGELYGELDFLGPKGRIRAEQRVADTTDRYGNESLKQRPKRYWYHHSFPTLSPFRKRLPITTANVRRLRAAVLPASGSVFLRKRRYLMLDVLDITGGRRYEVANLMIASVMAAAKMDYPVLKLLTVKKRNQTDQYRYLPISKHDLRGILEYIDKNRAPVIRKTCGATGDTGYVFVSETTGLPLRPNTITQEIHLLARSAGIEERTSPQMFRHRFITRLFVTLIELHRCHNEDEFRKAILDTEGMKRKVQQWTGHSSLSSLEGYIHLAFDEVANYRKTLGLMDIERLVDSLDVGLEDLHRDLERGVSSEEIARELKGRIEAARLDIRRFKEPK